MGTRVRGATGVGKSAFAIGLTTAWTNYRDSVTIGVVCLSAVAGVGGSVRMNNIAGVDV